MKKIITLFLITSITFSLSGCFNYENNKNSDLEQQYINRGTEETFAYGNFQITISNVKEIKTKQSTDGYEIWDENGYVVFPGSKVNIINADLKIGEGDKLYPAWAFKNADETFSNITEGMDPVDVYEQEVVLIYNIESKTSIVSFEMCEK